MLAFFRVTRAADDAMNWPTGLDRQMIDPIIEPTMQIGGPGKDPINDRVHEIGAISTEMTI